MNDRDGHVAAAGLLLPQSRQPQASRPASDMASHAEAKGEIRYILLIVARETGIGMHFVV
jgi:hypothetical protein